MLSTLKILSAAKSTGRSFTKLPRETDEKNWQRIFFRYRNLITTALLPFQARLNPWWVICLMTKPFPKGTFSVELSLNFSFAQKSNCCIQYALFIKSPQILTCTNLLSRKSMWTSARLVCFLIMCWMTAQKQQVTFFAKYKSTKHKHEITVLLLECCLEIPKQTTPPKQTNKKATKEKHNKNVLVVCTVNT